VNTLVTRWQSLFGRAEHERAALAEVQSDRDDTIAYLSTLRAVMEVLERARNFEQVCQGIAETLVVELGAETCALAMRDRPDEQFQLRGFANQSLRLGGTEVRSSVAESIWLTAATLMSAGGQPSFYRSAADGTIVAAQDLGNDAGLLGMPLKIGGERNGVIILEYLAAPAQHFARRPAQLCTNLEREVGDARDALSEQERSLREREDSVSDLTQALIASNQVKRDFLGTLSHELRTPLNAILGYSELLHDGLVGSLTNEQMGMLERVMVNTRHLNILIDDMLFFVQLEAKQTAVRREAFSLGELVSDVAAALPDRFGRSEAKLRVEIAPGVETLCSDRGLLKRVVFHLLSNGFKFTPAGEVVLTATPWESHQGIVLSVRDNGVGIAQGRLDDIFQLFRQLDMSTTRPAAGLGLGLALVKRCVQILGGEVGVRTAPGEGSEFTIRIPATDPEMRTVGQSPSA
jgi:signal transduction histidine kinase